MSAARAGYRTITGVVSRPTAGPLGLLVNAGQVKNLPGRKSDAPMPRGWPSWVRTVWSAAPSCCPRRTASCGI